MTISSSIVGLFLSRSKSDSRDSWSVRPVTTRATHLQHHRTLRLNTILSRYTQPRSFYLQSDITLFLDIIYLAII